MLPYWILYFFPAAVALNVARRRGFAQYGFRSERLSIAWILVILMLTLFIGYRYKVGGDWYNYFRYIELVGRLEFKDIFQSDDPGYLLINWLSVEQGWGVYGINLISGFIFSTGLVAFCRHLPRPWLALAVAVPYLVIVVGMGYSRQGVALGLVMIGLVALGRGSHANFVFWVLLGATFHKTAVLMIPVAALSASRNRYLVGLWVGVSAVIGYWTFLQDTVGYYLENYVEAGYQSSGALIRLTMNIVPAVILLRYRRRFEFNENQKRLWNVFALISVGLWAAFFVISSSTALDRIALYMLPLQLVVFSQVPDIFGAWNRNKTTQVAAVLGYYAAVQFVWLFFSVHSRYWLPYQFYPLAAL